jgi:ADP-heptose:LPS heptosyltransferase
MHKFLVIQTAFTGDVVLATGVIEKLRTHFPGSQIDFLLRKGNEGLLKGHPFITNLHIWNKQHQKKRNLLRMAFRIRKENYTHVINLHRFVTSGLVTAMSGAPYRSGFDKNPMSYFFTRKVKHIISEPYDPNPVLEVQRNQSLIADITDNTPASLKLYPPPADYEAIKEYTAKPYVCIAPASVWFTKRFPIERWVGLINLLPQHYPVYIIGGPDDAELARRITSQTIHKGVENLCGKLSFLQSAALMEGAAMNYANDSAPLHFASAMNAPVTGVFCSTVPAFGFFGPERENARVVEISERLYCRPCGLHGHKTCPQGHFRCAHEITNDQLLWWISKTTSNAV